MPWMGLVVISLFGVWESRAPCSQLHHGRDGEGTGMPPPGPRNHGCSAEWNLVLRQPWDRYQGSD